MTRAWTLRAAPVAMLLVAACQDAPTTPLELPEDDGGELSFVVPNIAPWMLVDSSMDEDQSAPAGPARVIEEGEELPPPSDETIDPSTVPESDIWNARTTVGFQTGSAWAMGRHDYQGNKSDITTRVTVSLDGTVIGSQSAYVLEDIFFLADFGLPKSLQAIARAFVSQECGLMARGDSDHAAWWEAVPGLNFTSFNKSALTTYSPEPAFQPECAPPPPPTTGGGGGDGGYCLVSIWYDPYTGEVVDWEILYCEGGDIGG